MSQRRELMDVVDGMFEEVLAVIRSAQESNLTHAWRLGQILEQALSAFDDTYGRGIARELVRRLNEANCEIKLSTLYAYRTIYLTYREDEIPALVQRGLTQTHAQTLASLPTAIRQEVEDRMHRDDGSVLSTRELKRLATEVKKDQTREECVAVAEKAAQARVTGDTLTLVPRVQASPAEAGDRVGASAVTVETVPEPMPETRSGDPERSRAMARAGSRDFTHPPLKTLKTADSTVIKLLAQASRIIQTLEEAGRIGFDSERSQQNFIDAAESLDASLASYERLLPELRERLRQAVGANVVNA